MLRIPNIRILETDAKKRGDLFARLMGDLFFALGYEDVRFNVHKSGREIDIQAAHRTERRRVVAECKATQEKVGGDEINKFVGALDAERRQADGTETVGYFISLYGFKESAIQQENDAGGRRVILLDGQRVIGELIKGRIVVSLERAMERAGRCAAEEPADLRPQNDCDLLAHELGWIWALYFAHNKQRTHFSLVHADGECLSATLANTIMESDRCVGGQLKSLTYLQPLAAAATERQMEEAKQRYLEYLAEDCGDISLEGLPADEEAGTLRPRLERLFVPLCLKRRIQLSIAPRIRWHDALRRVWSMVETTPTFARPTLASVLLRDHDQEGVHGPGISVLDDIPTSATVRRRNRPDVAARQPVGEVLSRCSRLAILAAPGGGKTTLLKRLAVAYAFPDRGREVDDGLPDRRWFPLFIRCRRLRELAAGPIHRVLAAIPQWAECPELSEPFISLVTPLFRTGNALLLIDGLDEISDERDRITFVNQLRIFLATYPAVSIVVTSREAGFRVVGGSLASHCEHYTVAEFDDDDVRRLIQAWHREVVGDKEEVRTEAAKLADTICNSDRIRRLAGNPLLLTTLLLVKRWVGRLPTRRTVLYQKAIEVLLMTWNVAAHEEIAPDEAIPQLAFVAFTMMQDGSQRISLKSLKQVLLSARKQMPEILEYARMGVTEFVQRVEDRSSLMILSGHEIEEGTLCPMYEFRHLTFQEYLAAVAVVEGYYPGRKNEDAVLSVLEPLLTKDTWKEIIPLAAVLAGRRAQPLIEHLIRRANETRTGSYYESPYYKHFSLRSELRSIFTWTQSTTTPVTLLAQCFADECQVPPALLKEGLRCIATRLADSQFIVTLRAGKYGDVFSEAVREAYATSRTDLHSLGTTLARIKAVDLGVHWRQESSLGTALARIKSLDLDVSEPQESGGWFTAWSKISKQMADECVYRIVGLLRSQEPTDRAAGAFLAANIARGMDWPNRDDDDRAMSAGVLVPLGECVLPLLSSDSPPMQYAACEAVLAMGEKAAWDAIEICRMLPRLLTLWQASDVGDVKQSAANCLAFLPLVDREMKPFQTPDSALLDFLRKKVELFNPETGVVVLEPGRGSMSDFAVLDVNLRDDRTIAGDMPTIRLECMAALRVAFYCRAPWSDIELAKRVGWVVSEERWGGYGLTREAASSGLWPSSKKTLNIYPMPWTWDRSLLEALGEPGATVLRELKKKHFALSFLLDELGESVSTPKGSKDRQKGS